MGVYCIVFKVFIGEEYRRIYGRGYPHSNAFLQFPLKSERCKAHKAASHQTKCDLINDVKVFRQNIALFRRKLVRRRVTKSSV